MSENKSRSFIEKLWESVERLKSRYEESDGIIKNMLTIYIDNELKVYGGYAALKIFSALFPFLMLLLTLLNRIPGYNPEALADFVCSFVPDIPQMQELLRNILSNLFVQSSGSIMILSLAASLYSSSRGVSATQKGLEKISGFEAQTTKQDIRQTLKSIVFTVMLLLLFPAMLMFDLLGGLLKDGLQYLFDLFGVIFMGGNIAGFISLSSVITAAVCVFAVLITYVWLPGGRRTVKSQLPGVLFTSVGGVAFTELFTVFIKYFWKSSVYGSLASVFLVIMWLQSMINILYLGAELNEILMRRKENVRG